MVGSLVFTFIKEDLERSNDGWSANISAYMANRVVMNHKLLQVAAGIAQSV